MSDRDDRRYRIDDAADSVIDTLPSLNRHPGLFVKNVLLPEYGLSTSALARAIGVDRAGLSLTLSGRYDVSRDLAYKLGALMRDEIADLLIACQHAYTLAREAAKREGCKAVIQRLDAPNVDRAG